MKTEFINKEEVKGGDTLIIDSVMTTICLKNIKRDPFFGTLINGLNIRGKIKRVLFPKWYKGVLKGYFTQI